MKAFLFLPKSQTAEALNVTGYTPPRNGETGSVNSINNKGRLASGISVLAIATSLGMASPALAQAELGSIEGHVAGAKAGTQVVAVDTHTGQRSVGTVDSKGNYSILGLRPSDYTVTVDGKTQNTNLQVGQAVTLAKRRLRARTPVQSW
jgi:hypothetical protein